MTIDIVVTEASSSGRHNVMAWFSDPAEKCDALIECGLAFSILFPDSDFEMGFLPACGHNLFRERAVIWMEICEEDKLPSYIRASCGKIKGDRKWRYTGNSFYRRDWIMRFEFQEKRFDYDRPATQKTA